MKLVVRSRWRETEPVVRSGIRGGPFGAGRAQPRAAAGAEPVAPDYLLAGWLSPPATRRYHELPAAAPRPRARAGRGSGLPLSPRRPSRGESSHAGGSARI